MNCYICDQNNWHIRKDLNPQKAVGICKNCGNVAFQVEEEEEKKIRDFYRGNYRSKPGAMIIITTTHKLNFIKIFLSDWLKDKKNLLCTDIGAGSGYLCDWLRRRGHRATGTELTLSFRRFSEHYYGIPLTEEIVEKHRYDLIVFYHSLEHMVEPDKKLQKCTSLLADDGVIMISVPEWFHKLENLAQEGELTIENYFHTRHLNCFTERSMKNLFNKCKLEIIKEDHDTYGQTYLVGKYPPNKVAFLKGTNPIDPEKWQTINAKIDKIKKAIDLFKQGKLKDALEAWNYFPDASLKYIFDSIRKEPDRQEHELKGLLEKFPNDAKVLMAYGIWYYQNQKYEEAIKYLDKSLSIAPHEDVLVYIGWSLDRLGKYPEAMMAFSKAMVMNPQKWRECVDWMSHCACEMPTWDERAKMEIKNKLFEQAEPKIELADPRMEKKVENPKSPNK